MQPEEIDVRPVEERDLPILDYRLHRYTAESHLDRFEDQRRGYGAYLIAWAGDEPVGHAQLVWRQIPKLEQRFPGSVTLRELQVSPAVRSRGAGTKIMESAEKMARAAGRAGIAVGVEPDNARAADFYRRRGYFDVGIAPWESRPFLLTSDEIWHEAGACLLLFKKLSSGDEVQVIARAKINLYLGVGPRRPDGYHEIVSVMQAVTLADELTLRPAKTTRVATRWAGGYGGALPEGKNIAESAILQLRSAGLLDKEVAVEITKRIPVGAGLAGGSADAAAALAGGAALSGRTIGRKTLMQQAANVGADVPFCLEGGTALAAGKGEHLESFDCKNTMWWVVGIAGPGLSTEQVYRRPDPGRDKPAEVSARETAGKLVVAMKDGNFSAAAKLLHNDLEDPAFLMRPELRRLKRTMADCGAAAAIMSGSGSAIAGLCETEGDAIAAAKNARRHFSRVEVAAGPKPGAQLAGVS